MVDCIKEQDTQHHCWWRGFGPVEDRELIVFAVFEKTAKSGLKLTSDSFENRYLVSDELSLARPDYISLNRFYREVVNRGQQRKGKLIGVVFADANRLRKIPAEIPAPEGRILKVRALCILDRVEHDDYDAHATAGYCEATEAVTGVKLGIARSKIRLALALEFGEIVDAGDLRWASIWQIFVGRIRWIRRSLRRRPASD